MKVIFKVFILILFSPKIYCQCFPPPPNTTATITGLYTSDINLPPASIIYIAPSATVTGNIYLNNSSLYNCGIILSSKIVMKQSLFNHQYTIQNSNYIKCDSLILDSLGHLHNNDSLICNHFQMGYTASADNYYFMEAKRITVESWSWFSSLGLVKSDYMVLKGNDTRFLVQYGRAEIKKLLQIDSSATVHGVGFICVDSCLINKGTISMGNNPPLYSYMKVSGISNNSGLMLGFDFCDFTNIGSGEPDINTGTLSSITFCQTEGELCNFYSTEIIEKENPIIKIGIYPNPTNEILFIIDNERYDLEDAKLEVYNSIGQVVLSETFSNNINVSSLAQGVYSLRIKQKSGQILYSNFIKE
ncbi:MAG: T9SS type A sorting domain-containing protein [Bacteroidia bacterium]|nr:T9SS type A sorting domain-containing protein [Bacteroidia bacterium]